MTVPSTTTNVPIMTKTFYVIYAKLYLTGSTIPINPGHLNNSSNSSAGAVVPNAGSSQATTQTQLQQTQGHVYSPKQIDGVFVRTTVKEALSNAGGLSTLIYLITMAKSKFQQRKSLQLLHIFLKYYPQNVKEMKDISGHELVGFVMRKPRWELDEPLVAILFEFVGLKKSISGTYSSGVIR